MGHKPNFLAAAFLVVLDEDKILLSKRKNTGWMDGYYSMITGHFEDNEMGTDAIAREANEEAGITVNKEDLTFLHCQERISYQTDGSIKPYFDFYYKVGKYTGEIQNMEVDKCDGFEWFKIDELPDLIVPGMRIVIEAIKLGVDYSEFYGKKTDE
jgi:8-oxo-dGTP pyrophosphatase MutT (NUDIX family)